MIAVRPEEIEAGLAALRGFPSDDLACVARDGHPPEALRGERIHRDAITHAMNNARDVEWARGVHDTLDRDPRTLGLRGWLIVIDERGVAHVVGLPLAN